jgi:hypothetical protein
MIRIFAGYDPRESVGYHVFCQSVIEHTTEPVAITPFFGKQRDGTNAFIYQRFLVPYFTGFKGRAIFMDASDMLMLTNIVELHKLFDPTKAVQVVKHEYKTKHKKKYIGTKMEAKNEDYPRKNWSSMILWNCEHPANRCLTPDYVDDHAGSELHRFSWLPDKLIGDLQKEWNVLVGEQDNPNAKIAHYTLGIPEFTHYKYCDYAQQWFNTKSRMLDGLVNIKEKELA